jgi:hypothetical protein
MMNAEQKLYLNKRIAYTALMLQEYAYREILDSPLIRENDRYMVKRKYNYVTSQIRKINNSSKATKAPATWLKGNTTMLLHKSEK